LFLSPDGQWLAVPLADAATSNVWAFPTCGGPMKPLTDFGDRSNLIARSVSWSGDGQFLFAAIAEIETDIVLFDGLTGDGEIGAVRSQTRGHRVRKERWAAAIGGSAAVG
jgi:hypothetical protein